MPRAPVAGAAACRAPALCCGFCKGFERRCHLASSSLQGGSHHPPSADQGAKAQKHRTSLEEHGSKVSGPITSSQLCGLASLCLPCAVQGQLTVQGSQCQLLGLLRGCVTGSVQSAQYRVRGPGVAAVITKGLGEGGL